MSDLDIYFLTMGGYRCSLLKLQGYKHKPMSLKSFLRWFLRNGYKYRSLYLNNRIQCKKYHYRSLGDIFRICKYYYPAASFIEVRRLVLKSEYLRGHFCGDVKRRIYAIHPMWERYSIGKYDEFGFLIYYYRGYKKIKRWL